mmetsp:Transcript_108819/g.306655  ORF Transcript_108819/g.306655 Transcript_108819/m.306655 type:complete len:215 (+) Transcript_108819:1058-1702(+)
MAVPLQESCPCHVRMQCRWDHHCSDGRRSGRDVHDLRVGRRCLAQPPRGRVHEDCVGRTSRGRSRWRLGGDIQVNRGLRETHRLADLRCLLRAFPFRRSFDQPQLPLGGRAGRGVHRLPGVGRHLLAPHLQLRSARRGRQLGPWKAGETPWQQGSELQEVPCCRLQVHQHYSARSCLVHRGRGAHHAARNGGALLQLRVRGSPRRRPRHETGRP